MVALDESWPRRVGAIRSITTDFVAGIFVSAFLTFLVIAVRVSVACMTLTGGELWQIILSISAVPTLLIGWITAIRKHGARDSRSLCSCATSMPFVASMRDMGTRLETALSKTLPR